MARAVRVVYDATEVHTRALCKATRSLGECMLDLVCLCAPHIPQRRSPYYMAAVLAWLTTDIADAVNRDCTK